jgi:hypothetical protein
VKQVDRLVAEIDQHIPVASDGLQTDQPPRPVRADRGQHGTDRQWRGRGGVQLPGPAEEQTGDQEPDRDRVKNVRQLVWVDQIMALTAARIAARLPAVLV